MGKQQPRVNLSGPVVHRVSDDTLVYEARGGCLDSADELYRRYSCIMFALIRHFVSEVANHDERVRAVAAVMWRPSRFQKRIFPKWENWGSNNYFGAAVLVARWATYTLLDSDFQTAHKLSTPECIFFRSGVTGKASLFPMPLAKFRDLLLDSQFGLQRASVLLLGCLAGETAAHYSTIAGNGPAKRYNDLVSRLVNELRDPNLKVSQPEYLLKPVALSPDFLVTEIYQGSGGVVITPAPPPVVVNTPAPVAHVAQAPLVAQPSTPIIVETSKSAPVKKLTEPKEESVLRVRSRKVLLSFRRSLLEQVPIELIDPQKKQPREYFDPRRLEELQGSMAEGQIQPIKLCFNSQTGRYTIIDGERRYRSAVAEGIRFLDAEVYDGDMTADEIFTLSVAANLAREGHCAYENVQAVRRLLSLGFKKVDIGRSLGRSPVWVLNNVKMGQLPQPILDLIHPKRSKEERLSLHVLLLLAELPEEVQQDVAAHILQHKLPNREATAYVERRLSQIGSVVSNPEDYAPSVQQVRRRPSSGSHRNHRTCDLVRTASKIIERVSDDLDRYGDPDRLGQRLRVALKTRTAQEVQSVLDHLLTAQQNLARFIELARGVLNGE